MKRMSFGVVFAAAAVLLAAGGAFAAPNITNLRQNQIYPFRKVAFEYRLSEATTLKPTIKCIAGSTTNNANTLIGDVNGNAGWHRIVWDVEADGFVAATNYLRYIVSYGTQTSVTTGNSWVGLGSGIKDGMAINGKQNFNYFPLGGDTVELILDGETLVCATNMASFLFQPRETGNHTLVHKTGDYEWTRTYKTTTTSVGDGSVARDVTLGTNHVLTDATGKQLSVFVTAANDVSWQVNSGSDWITVGPDRSAYYGATGSTNMFFNVASYTGKGTRVGTIFIGGKTFKVVQNGGANAPVYYVNASSGNDTNSGTNSSVPKKTIQSAISAAPAGTKIIIADGNYSGNVEISKPVELIGAGASKTTITGNGNGSVVKITADAAGTKVSGFTLTGGSGDTQGYNTYGGAMTIAADATVSSCVMHDNGKPYFGGAVHSSNGSRVLCYDCAFYSCDADFAGKVYLVEGGSIATLDHCTVYNTSYSALTRANTGTLIVKDSIVWGRSYGLLGTWSPDDGYTTTVSYSCVQGGASGTGNISSDPQFVSVDNANFTAKGTECQTAGSDGKAIGALFLQYVCPHYGAVCEAPIAPGCTTSGSSGNIECPDCDTILDAAATLPALGHSPKTTKAATEATCQKAGNTEEIKCSRCNLVLQASETIPIKAHEASPWTVTKEATASAKGIKTKFCLMCWTVLETEEYEYSATPSVPADGTYTTNWNGIDWHYTVSGGEASLGENIISYAIPSSQGGIIIIPSELNGCKVTAIKDYAFYQNTAITAVVIPDTVRSVGKSAFKGCTGLSCVVIGNQVQTIGDWCFSGSTALASVVYRGSEPSIGSYAFYNVSADCVYRHLGSDFTCTHVEVQKLVLREPSDFAKGLKIWICTQCGEELDSIEYDLSVADGTYTETIDGTTWTFVVSQGEASLGTGGWGNNSAVDSNTGGAITIPSELKGCPVTAIGTYAFYENTKISSVIIPDSVRTIGQFAFYNSSVENMQLGRKVLRLDYASISTSSLKSIVARGNAPSTGSNALRNRTATIYINDTASGWGAVGSYWLDRALIQKNTTCKHETSTLAGATVTCTEVGYSGDLICDGCGKVMEYGSMVAASGHEGVISSPAVASTCTVKGKTAEYRCKRCAALVTASKEVALAAHTPYTSKAAVSPTCTEAGSTEEKSCRVCSKVTTASKTVAALGHASVVAVAAKAATCSETGCTEGTKCSRCGITLVTSKTIAKLAHTEQITKAAQAATCGAAGWTKASVCSVCGATMATSTAIPATGNHTEKITKAAQAATCVAAGWTKASVCSVCGATMATSTTIPATGKHTEKITKTAHAATCTETGWTKASECSVCGATMATSSSIPALGHQKGSGTVSIAAEYQKEGRMDYLCTRCGVILESETIPALDAQPDGGPYTETIDGVEWPYIVSGGIAKIGGYSYNSSVNPNGATVLHIPGILGNRPVGELLYSAFYDGVNCSNIREIHIPSSVTAISSLAFEGTYYLEKILVDEENPGYSSVDGILYNKEKTRLLLCPRRISELPSGIPGTVTNIYNYAFKGCWNISGVELPDGLKTIGYSAFSGASRLKEIVIPSGVTGIGENAFRNCYSMTNAVLPEGLKKIEPRTFKYCSQLQSIYIPGSVEWIGQSAFEDCTKLARVAFGATSTLPDFYITDGERMWNAVDDGIDPGKAIAREEPFYNANGTNVCHGYMRPSVTKFPQRIYTYDEENDWFPNTVVTNYVSTGKEYPWYGLTLKRCVHTGTHYKDDEHGTELSSYGICGTEKCPLCEMSLNYGHAYFTAKEAVSPTCTQSGNTWRVECSRCNKVLVSDKELPALGHVEVETKAAQEPTCTLYGMTHEVSCSRCNEILETSKIIPELGHVEVETKAAKSPTCTEDGWTREVTCSRCSEILETSQTILKLGHVEVETKPAQAPTCTQDGWTHEVKCSRCNEVLAASETIAKLGHVEAETKAAQSATCTQDGWTREISCSRCNVLLSHSEPIPALGHSSAVSLAAISPTCTAAGRTARLECSRCGELLQQSEALAALGHSGAITKPAVEPTSSTAGWTAEVTCTRCGAILQNQEEIPALGYIRNVTAAQLWPHRKVALKYELAPDIADVAAAGAVVSLKGSYGSTTKTATNSRIYGDTSCTPGIHHVVWDVEGDSIAHAQSSMSFSIAYGAASATTSCWVALSSSVADGMSINGSKKNVWFSPFGDGEVQLMIDGNVFLSSTNFDKFAWQPQTAGPHTLVHKSGSYSWSRTLTVSSVIWDVPPAPNPPTAEDWNISIGSTSRSFVPGGGSGTITTSGSGTWNASASDDWITFPAYSSNTAGRPVAYKVLANSGVEGRTGYIYVSGHVFTVTQAGVGAALGAYSADFEADGGSGSFAVLADAQSDWNVRSDVDWISVTVEGTGSGGQGTVGSGEQRVLFAVAPFNEVMTRSGTITAAGCTFTVNQTGRRMKLVVADPGGAAGAWRPPCQVERDYQNHVIDIQVNALASTGWDIELVGTWISIADGGSGHGGDNVAIAINENPSWLPRSGTVRIGTEYLTIIQSGRPPSALEFAINPEEAAASVKGANGLISVMATPDLPWTAQSQANWLTVMPSFLNGAGNGNVVYSVSPNPTMAARTGAIRVEAVTSAALPAKSHTVTQPAATAMISADAHTFNAAGEPFNVEVTTDDIVNWTISEDCDWISVIGSTSRIGPGAVVVSADGNDTVDPRETTVMIAGHQFAVFQKGRTVEVEYESRVFGTASDYATIDVHPDGNVTWVAATDSPDWIVIWGDDGCEYDSDGNVVGTGDHTIEYIVSDYVGDGTPRTGTITIGDKTVYITQRAYELSINPSATTVSGNANEGEVSVPATAGQIWNAIATEPWITVVSGYDSGTGSGTVRYTYTDNDTGEERTGRIIIAGEEYTITQAARQMVAVNVTTRVVTGSGEPTTGNGGVVSGAGTYDRGTSVTLTATANDGYEFLNWTLPNGSTTGGAQLVVTADVNKEIFANFRRIPVYAVNGESVREGTSKTFTAPADVIDDAGTTKLVCLGTSRYPEKGTSFTLVVTEDISFEWDIWQTNYLVAVSQSSGGAIKNGSSLAPTTAWYPAGSTIDLTATPNSGKSFFRWNLSNPDNPVNPVENISAHSASLRLCVNQPATVSAVFGTFSDTLSTALDAPALTFTTGGDAEWQPAIDATAQTGYTSARSGTIGAESETWLDTTVNGAGTLTFRWRVDCEKDDGGGATWDRLAVFTNGVEAARIDGKTGWQTVTIELPNSPTPNSPTQTLIRWSFYRDDYDEPGQTHENRAWVDGIIFNKEGNE